MLITQNKIPNRRRRHISRLGTFSQNLFEFDVCFASELFTSTFLCRQLYQQHGLLLIRAGRNMVFGACKLGSKVQVASYRKERKICHVFTFDLRSHFKNLFSKIPKKVPFNRQFVNLCISLLLFFKYFFKFILFIYLLHYTHFDDSTNTYKILR